MAPYRAQFLDVLASLQTESGKEDRGAFWPQREAGRGLTEMFRWLERFRAELRFADQLCAAFPEQAETWRDLILQAGRSVQDSLQAFPFDLESAVRESESLLAPISAVAKDYTLLCISHAHIDMNWMWGWPETVAVTNDTFQTMLSLMDEFPSFIYSQDQASTYRLIEQYNPAMFQEIRRRVQQGRWEVTASHWVEADKNMSSGESQVRHLLYTRAYFQDRFGLSPEDVQIDFEPDTFGHPATVPTILAHGGVRYYYHCRGSHGPHLYWWVGGDGSRVLVFNDSTWYMCAVEPRIADPLVEFSLTTGLKCRPVLYGVGDHGGGPTRRDLRRIQEMNAWPVYPHVEFSTLHRFFRLAEAEARDLPLVAGERNFVFTGCYTSQARQKWANRRGENLLYTAESAAVVGAQLAGVPYPYDNLDGAWREVLFEQFHDILPGSGVRETRHYALGRAQDVQAAASMARSNAIRALSAQVDTAALLRPFSKDGRGRAHKDRIDGERAFGAGVGNSTSTGGESVFSVARRSDRAIIVFNPLPYGRTDVIEFKLWDVTLDESQLIATFDPLSESAGLDPQPVQILDRGKYWGHEFLTVAVPVRVPAFGYSTLCISDRKAELGLLDEEIIDPWVGMGGSWRKIERTPPVLENEFLRVSLDPAAGCISSLLDKTSGQEWVPKGGLTGILQRCLESNEGMTAWVIGRFVEREDLTRGGTLKQVHRGPHLTMWRWTYPRAQVGAYDTRIELDITVRQGVPRVEFRLRVDWREIGHPEEGIPHLRVHFPLSVADPRPRFEIPFGSIVRGPMGVQDMPAQRWVDLSGSDGAGVTLVNSSKYGFSVEEQGAQVVSIDMTLLRASIDPDPLPDLGEHIIEYALVPHGTEWTVGDCFQAGEAWNVPLVVSSCEFHDGELPSVGSFMSIEDKNVRLVALKEGQDHRSVILRLVEVEGTETRTRIAFSSELFAGKTRAVEVDAMERALEKNSASLQEGILSVDLAAYGVTTVRLEA